MKFSFRFVFHQSYACMHAGVDTDPDTLNLKSNGKFVTVYIELPEGYNVEDIDLEIVRLEGVPQ